MFDVGKTSTRLCVAVKSFSRNCGSRRGSDQTSETGHVAHSQAEFRWTLRISLSCEGTINLIFFSSFHSGKSRHQRDPSISQVARRMLNSQWVDSPPRRRGSDSWIFLLPWLRCTLETEKFCPYSLLDSFHWHCWADLDLLIRRAR